MTSIHQPPPPAPSLVSGVTGGIGGTGPVGRTGGMAKDDAEVLLSRLGQVEQHIEAAMQKLTDTAQYMRQAERLRVHLQMEPIPPFAQSEADRHGLTSAALAERLSDDIQLRAKDMDQTNAVLDRLIQLRNALIAQLPQDPSVSGLLPPSGPQTSGVRKDTDLSARAFNERPAQDSRGASSTPPVAQMASSQGVATVLVPSTLKLPDPGGGRTRPFVLALNSLIDENGRSRTTNPRQDLRGFAGQHAQTLTAFAEYFKKHENTISQRNGGNFHIGFDQNSDSNDIARALESSAVRREFESFLRLAVQGGGTAPPPNTPILPPAG